MTGCLIRFPAMLAFVLLIAAGHSRGQSDSLLAAYKATTGAEERGNLAYKIASQIPDAEAERYVAYAREGYAVVRNLEVPAKAKLANVLGYYQQQQRGNYDSAAFFYRIALATAERIGNEKLKATMVGNLGEVYSLKGKYADALRYELSALNYYETQKATSDIQRLIISIGNTYYHMGSYRQALSYFNRIYPALRNEKSYAAASLFNSLALTYGELGQNERVDEMQQRALAIHRAAEDTLAILNTVNNLGKTAVGRNDYIAAENYFKEALRLAQQLRNKSLEDVERQNLAFIQAKAGNAAAAAVQYRKSVEAAQAAGNVRLEKAALESLIAIYDSSRDYAAANRYMAEYERLEETMHSKAYVGEMADAETRYQTQKALRDRDHLSYERNLQTAAASSARRQRNNAITISGISLLALLLIFGLAWRIRAIRARTQEERRATRAVFEGEQAERIRIARDLHDSIGQMLAVVKMRLTSQPADEADNKAVITNLVDKTIDEVRAISHNLIPEDLTFGTVRALENLCARMAAGSGLAVQLSVDDAVRAHRFNQEFGLSLYRIVQEVLGNMIKHSGASAIGLDMAQSSGVIILQITDNGKGFDTGLIGHSSGIGWKNIYARVGLLNGSVDVRSERISGTRIQISIPQ